MGGALPQATVVVVNFNSGVALAACVESLLTRAGSRVVDVVVVDNASTDGSVEGIEGRWPMVRVIHNLENRGLAAGNNQGILASEAPYVVLCNPDVVFPGDAVAALCDLLDRRPRAAVAGTKMSTPDGRLHPSAGDLPRLREALLGRAGYGNFMWTSWSHDEERRAGRVAEACYAIRRQAIDEVGLQDPGYFLYWEGVDWAQRFARASWETWFCPTAEVVHVGGVSVGRARLRSVLWSHAALYRYFRKWSRVPRPVLATVVGARALGKLAAVSIGYRKTQPPFVPSP